VNITVAVMRSGRVGSRRRGGANELRRATLMTRLQMLVGSNVGPAIAITPRAAGLDVFRMALRWTATVLVCTILRESWRERAQPEFSAWVKPRLAV